MNGELITTAYTYHDGRVALNNAFSGTATFNIFDASMISSGGTDLGSIFLSTNNITRVQPGLNITTGGTADNPIINLSSSPSITNLNVSGNTSLQAVSATTINIQSIGESNSSITNIGIDSLGNIVSGTSTAFQLLSDSATILWDYKLGTNAEITLGGNRTLLLTGISDGSSGVLLVKQDSSGNRTLSLTGTSGTHKVVGGGSGTIVLSSKGNSEDILSFIYKSSTSTYYWNIGYEYN